MKAIWTRFTRLPAGVFVCCRHNITKHITPLLLLCTLLLGFGACKKDDPTALPCDDVRNPECPNYDPCWKYSPANSAFVVIDSVRFIEDTVLALPIIDTTWAGSIFFRNEQPTYGAAYEWQIGQDVRLFTDPIFKMNFVGFTGGNVTVRSVVSVQDDENGCLNESQLRDTSYRTFTIVPVDIDNFPMLGTFKGTVEQTGEPLTLEIYIHTNPNQYVTPRLLGLDLDCPPVGTTVGSGNGIQLRVSYDSFVTNHNTGQRCRNLTAIGRVLPENRNILQVDYFYNDDSGRRRHEVFTGYRQ